MICNKCEKDQDESEFYKGNKMCKACKKKRASDSYNRRVNGRPLYTSETNYKFRIEDHPDIEFKTNLLYDAVITNDNPPIKDMFFSKEISLRIQGRYHDVAKELQDMCYKLQAAYDKRKRALR